MNDKTTTSLTIMLILISGLVLTQTSTGQITESKTISAYGEISQLYVVSTDNSSNFTNIESAIASLPPSGGTIYVKEGTYTINQTINIKETSITMIGENQNTIFVKESGIMFKIADVEKFSIFNIHMLHLDNNYCTALHFDGNNNDVTIKNCKFTRDSNIWKEKSTDFVWFNSSGLTKNLLIQNCYFERAQVDAIAIKSIIGGTIENNTIIDAATQYYDYAAGITVDQCSNVTIRGNQFIRTGEQQMVAVNIFNNSTDISIQENMITNMERVLSGHKVTNINISNNVINDFSEWCIRFQYLSKSIISNNNIKADSTNSSGIYLINSYKVSINKNYASGPNNGLVILDSDAITIFENNFQFLDQNLNPNLWGILLHNTTDSSIRKNIVSNSIFYGIAIHLSPATEVDNNTVSRSKTAGIRLWKSDNTIVSNCTISDNGLAQSTYYANNGIQLDESYNCTIIKNNSGNVNTQSQHYGIFENIDSDLNLITQNIVKGNAIEPIKASGKNTIVTNNQS